MKLAVVIASHCPSSISKDATNICGVAMIATQANMVIPERSLSRLIIICATAHTAEPAINNITLSR